MKTVSESLRHNGSQAAAPGSGHVPTGAHRLEPPGSVEGLGGMCGTHVTALAAEPARTRQQLQHQQAPAMLLPRAVA